MSRPRPVVGSQPGRLVATMLRALTAELSEPGRYRRGKEYARDGAVTDIDIQPGSVWGLVLGSRRQPYEVTLQVDAAPDDEIDAADDGGLNAQALLIPGRDEMAVWCSCPDEAGLLCKHAVATLLVFADESALEPELLARWRTASTDTDEVDRPDVVGDRLIGRGRVIDDGVAASAPPRHDPPAHLATSSRSVPARVDPLAGMVDARRPLPVTATLPAYEPPAPPPAELLDPAQRLLHELLTEAISTIRR